MAWLTVDNDSFKIDQDNFSDLQINTTASGENFYYFYNNKDRKLIKQFILKDGLYTHKVCCVTLIKKGDKFTPRLSFAIHNKIKGTVVTKEVKVEEFKTLKAIVSLDDCHENFWKLIAFLQSIRTLEIPEENFSLVSQSEAEIVADLRNRTPESVRSIIEQLSSQKGLILTEKDINQLLKRREKLTEFKTALVEKSSDESWWQSFFEENKWIFGYGLNYQILKQEETQPHYGGTKVDGTGGQKGDYLTSTAGIVGFTVLVEIKTPSTTLLQGKEEIRRGAWSLSKNLTDALSQVEANTETWDKYGSEQPENRDRFEKEDVYTIQPKGIIIIGLLSELCDRNKRGTFQRFRKSIHGIDIVTFDELYERAKFIVEHTD